MAVHGCIPRMSSAQASMLAPPELRAPAPLDATKQGFLARFMHVTVADERRLAAPLFRRSSLRCQFGHFHESDSFSMHRSRPITLSEMKGAGKEHQRLVFWTSGQPLTYFLVTLWMTSQSGNREKSCGRIAASSISGRVSRCMLSGG